MCELVIKTAIGNGDLTKNIDIVSGFHEFVIELNLYCNDYYKHFGCYPLEFEFMDKIYQFNEFKDYIKN
jgi:hypothetical protein